jgi:hypothetical protein
LESPAGGWAMVMVTTFAMSMSGMAVGFSFG